MIPSARFCLMHTSVNLNIHQALKKQNSSQSLSDTRARRRRVADTSRSRCEQMGDTLSHPS